MRGGERDKWHLVLHFLAGDMATSDRSDGGFLNYHPT
jgi:hypothetical protein